MSAIKQPYCDYPLVEPTPDWACRICTNEDPKVKGGTVAHKEGEKHPIHRDCLLDSYQWSTLCPDCRADTDVSSLIPLMDKCRLAGSRIYHYLPDLYDKAKNWVRNPIQQEYLGFACMTVGALARKYSMLSAGMGIQSFALHQAIALGGPQIGLARRVRQLTEELISDLDKGRGVQSRRISELKNMISFQAPYYADLLKWVDSSEREVVLNGLKSTHKLANCVVYGDMIIRIWRAGLGIGALYYGAKSL